MRVPPVATRYSACTAHPLPPGSEIWRWQWSSSKCNPTRDLPASRAQVPRGAGGPGSAIANGVPAANRRSDRAAILAITEPPRGGDPERRPYSWGHHPAEEEPQRQGRAERKQKGTCKIPGE